MRLDPANAVRCPGVIATDVLRFGLELRLGLKAMEPREIKLESIRSLEARVLLVIAIVIAAAVTPILVFLQLTEMYADRLDPVLLVLFAIHVVLVGVMFLSRDVRARAVLIVCYLMFAGASALLHFGPVMSVGLAFLAAALIASIFLGERAAWIVWGHIVAALATGAFLFIKRIVPFYSPAVSALDSPLNWTRVCLTTVTLVTCIFLIFGMLMRRLKRLAFDAQSALESIQRERDERRSAELAFAGAQRFEIVSRVASGAAHDLNNILTAVKGAADMAALPNQTAQNLREDLALIKEGALRASVLTRQLLSFGRHPSAQRQRLDLAQAVRGIQGIVQRLLPPNVLLDFDSAAGLPEINADRTQIEQIVLNLCVNARDAMPDGGRLTVRVFAPAPELSPCGEVVLLTVSDAGTGIPDDIQARMFDPFFTTKEEGKGTGLGLATVRILVEAHGGVIQCASRVGEGTTMTVAFPTAESEENATWAPSRATPAAEALCGKERLVVCDADEMIRETARRILASAGYDVTTAGSSTAALEFAGTSGAGLDLAIVDATTPGLPLREFRARLLELRPSARVLIVAASDPLGLQLEPGQAILTKPFGRADLLSAVRRAIDGEVGRGAMADVSPRAAAAHR
jgi:signal transduction histidine kinase